MKWWNETIREIDKAVERCDLNEFYKLGRNIKFKGY